MQPRTPSPKVPAAISAPDTVSRSKHVSGPYFQSGELNKGRTAVLQDLQHLPTVSLDYFQRAILPELLPGIDIDAIRDSLIKSSIWTKDEGWANFHSEPCQESAPSEDAGSSEVSSEMSCPEPREDPRHEEVVFEGLERIFDDIVNHARAVAPQSPSPTLDLVAKPSKSPASHRNNSSRPDAYLLLKDKKSKFMSTTDDKDHWDDIAVSFEFKKGSSEGDRTDNEKKIIWNLHSIMREDPCRRSSFGVTIENTQVRLWFTSRTVTVVSEPFNFFTDIDNLIYLFCSLIFANDVELGWDPTIERVLVDGKIQYEIGFYDAEGSPAVYQTVKILSDFGADALRGRGTRVFKAFRKPKPQDTEVARVYVVIKDAWRDSTRMREDEILKNILHDIETNLGPSAREDAKQYFLTVLHAEDVMIDNKIDDTLRLLHHENIPADSRWHDVGAGKEKEPNRSTHTPSTGALPSIPLHLTRRTLPAVKSEVVHHKIHFRAVFAELGEPIHTLKKLDEVLETLEHALKGLEYMHRAGWVHRDISSGNVLRCNHQSKIADLEYAKSLTASGESHDVRTGTTDFMACEVEGHRYLFFKRRPTVVISAKYAPVPPEDQPFRFNPLHDLESWWWILTWVLHYNVDGDTQVIPDGHDAAYHSLFPGVVPGATRSDALRSFLKTKVAPPSFHSTISWADQMRLQLIEGYEAAEEGPEVNYMTPTRDSTKNLSTWINSARALVKDIEITLVPSHHVKKRQADAELADIVAGIVVQVVSQPASSNPHVEKRRKKRH
ncbi:hypothetical protein BU15DRAFT_83049 [Melanogaster broomeanus]|nr:hypothetical protein BU15DRAFT_83049 [Melanogaster broomeanus]